MAVDRKIFRMGRPNEFKVGIQIEYDEPHRRRAGHIVAASLYWPHSLLMLLLLILC